MFNRGGGRTRPTSKRIGRKTTFNKQQPKKKLSTFLLLAFFLTMIILMYGAFIGLSIRKLNNDSRQSKSNTSSSVRATTATSKRKWTTTTTSHQPLQYPTGRENPTSTFDFERHRTDAEAALRKDPDGFRRRTVLTAYTEPPLQDTVPGTGSRGDLSNNNKADWGEAPTFKVPLPLRTQTPSDLQKFVYQQVQTCRDIPGKFPIDRGLQFHSDTGDPIVWNVGDEPLPDNFAEQEAPYCPVELDPFLPWIHDVFPSVDGSKVHFIAQNKRRCRTGRKFTESVNRLVPQATLMQSVSVQQISQAEAERLAPSLWHGGDVLNTTVPRYRLAPYQEASPHGLFTRFICRFHLSTGRETSVPLGETLSQFPFNYELVSYRKIQSSLVSPNGKDTVLFWTSNLQFHCPVPDNLQIAIARGQSILSDDTPTLFVDIVPIRTSIRYEEQYLTEEMIGPPTSWGVPAFDPVQRWGNHNVLPRIEASGRWENIPICWPPQLVDDTTGTPQLVPDIAQRPSKPYFLSACLWASAEFKTRGRDKASKASSDTLDRLAEWIEFHLMVGFDHIYVYDNSGAHTNATNLSPVLDLFPPTKVTRIDWPSIVCNNNIPAHESTGERSSQYAAENSCRSRYAPFTEWIASFDTDEYFVPMGSYESLADFLRDAQKGGTNIVSLRSSRGRMRQDKSVTANGDAIVKDPKVTFLEAYNCDSAGSPKPLWADRARKQIYRTDYVLYHYVHYSTVTQGHLKTYQQAQNNGEEWHRRFGEKPPSERVSNELKEAVMIHTKSLGADMTGGYKRRCLFDYKKKWQGCWVAYPWPKITKSANNTHNEDGFAYNCFVNERVDNYWVPKLRQALAQRLSR